MAILAGAVAGLCRAKFQGQSYHIVDLRHLWLVLIAYTPQLFVFQLPATRSKFSVELAAVALVSSQILLLFFTWFNRDQPGFWLLSLGLALNFLVIVLNGGLMPISPETITRLIPGAPPGTWAVGERLGKGKDIVMIASDTRLWWLSDRFLLPAWFPTRAAYSIGDMVIAAGAFLFFWSSGSRKSKISNVNLEQEG